MVALVAAAVAATAGASAAFGYLKTSEFLVENMKSKGWGIARSVAPLMATPLLSGDVTLLGGLVNGIVREEPEVVYGAVLDRTGLVVVHSDPTKVRQRPDDALTAQALAAPEGHVGFYRDERGRPAVMDLVAPVRDCTGKLCGYVRLGLDMNAVRAQSYRVLTGAAMAAGPLLFLGLFATALLFRYRLDRPVRELRAAAAQAAAGDFTAEIRPDLPDDLGALARSLNLVQVQLGHLVGPLRDGLADIRRSAEDLLRACERGEEQPITPAELRPLARRLARLTERLHSLALQVKV